MPGGESRGQLPVPGPFPPGAMRVGLAETSDVSAGELELLKPLKTNPETVSAWSQPVHEGLRPRSVSTRDVSCFPRREKYRP